jgi:hypothetical protein
MRCDWGGVSLLLRGHGVHDDHLGWYRHITGNMADLLPIARSVVLFSHHPTVFDNEASSEIHSRSPIQSFPCLWLPLWLVPPLGFSSLLRTPPLPAAPLGVGTGIGHLPEPILSYRPLIVCDLVSHRHLQITEGSGHNRYRWQHSISTGSGVKVSCRVRR